MLSFVPLCVCVFENKYILKNIVGKGGGGDGRREEILYIFQDLMKIFAGTTGITVPLLNA